MSPNGLSNPLHLGTLSVLEATVVDSFITVSGITKSLTPVKLPISLQYPHGVNAVSYTHLRAHET